MSGGTHQNTYRSRILDALLVKSCTPADLDRACLGSIWTEWTAAYPPYEPALTELMDEGRVESRRDDDDLYHYYLTEDDTK